VDRAVAHRSARPTIASKPDMRVPRLEQVMIDADLARLSRVAGMPRDIETR
jgi:hypothetical protein